MLPTQLGPQCPAASLNRMPGVQAVLEPMVMTWRAPGDQRRGDIKVIKSGTSWNLDVGIICPGSHASSARALTQSQPKRQRSTTARRRKRTATRRTSCRSSSKRAGESTRPACNSSQLLVPPSSRCDLSLRFPAGAVTAQAGDRANHHHHPNARDTRIAPFGARGRVSLPLQCCRRSRRHRCCCSCHGLCRRRCCRECCCCFRWLSLASYYSDASPVLVRSSLRVVLVIYGGTVVVSQVHALHCVPRSVPLPLRSYSASSSCLHEVLQCIPGVPRLALSQRAANAGRSAITGATCSCRRAPPAS